MKWAVVQFESDDKSKGIEIATVPKSWIFVHNKKTHCRWPPSKVRKHILLQSEVEIGWQEFEVKIMFESEAYQDAINFEKKKEIGSTDTETELFISRSGRKRKVPRADDDFTDDEENYSSIGTPPKPPRVIEDDERSRASPSRSLHLDEYSLIMSSPPQTVVTNIIRNDKVTENNNIQETDICNIGRKCQECDHGGILQIILENTIAVRTILMEHHRILQGIGLQENKSVPITFDTVPKKPFSGVKKLKKYEDLLRNSEEAKKQLETVFYMIGGDPKDSIRRGLGKILSNKLATKYSFHGRKENLPMKNLIFTSILREATRKRFGVDLTDKEFEYYISLWLKQASLRHDREETKKKKEEEIENLL